MVGSVAAVAASLLAMLAAAMIMSCNAYESVPNVLSPKLEFRRCIQPCLGCGCCYSMSFTSSY